MIEAKETDPPHVHLVPLPAGQDAGSPFQRAGYPEAAQEVAAGTAGDDSQGHPRRYCPLASDKPVHYLVRCAIAANGNDHLVPPHSLSRQPGGIPRRLREDGLERGKDDA